jgi:short subunit fatty acids transporter
VTKPSPVERLLGALILLPFAVAILWLHHAKGVSFDYFIYGSGSWGIGCILKIVVYQTIVRRIQHTDKNILRVSALNGLFSGVSELGAALAIFAFMPAPSFWDLIAFGVGIGTLEALLVATPSNPLKGTGLEKPAAEIEAVIAGLPKGPRFVYGCAMPIVERLSAGGIHIGTRGLTYVTYRTANPVPIVLALLAFVLADGVIGYRLLERGKLKDLRVLNAFYLFFSVLALVCLGAFLLFWPTFSR